MAVPTRITRRRILARGGGLAAGLIVVRGAGAADLPAELSAAIKAFTLGAVPREGRVVLEIAELIENGNAVPVKVSVASPMTAQDHVTAIALFNERNPQPDVMTIRLGPRAGRAEVATRIRLATSQTVVAVARLSDGSCWTRTAQVIVTLAACIESED